MAEPNREPNYTVMTDEALASVAQTGDSEAERQLVMRFMPLVRLKSRPYFLIGAEEADLVQEGAIGLCSAIRDFDGGRNVSFRAYAEVCITNNVLAAIKRASRKKHMPLNTSISLDKPIDENGEGSETLADRLNAAAAGNPEELAIRREEELHVAHMLEEKLTELELRVLNLFLGGMSYKQIAETLGRSPKAADNALQRVKKKVAELLEKDHAQ